MFLVNWLWDALSYLGLSRKNAKILFLGYASEPLTWAAMRRIWKDYYATVDGIIFLVDAADRTRFLEAAEELRQLLECQELCTVPIAVLGNKIDIRNAAGEEEFRQCLGLHSHTTFGREVKSGAAQSAQESGIRPVEVFMCSVVKRMGYAEGFKWLAQFLD
ncbi:hypothetical protein FOZ60_017372 [Perkinsus olseni]|uniref:COPII coat GTPase n=1 Tax=Perkinsus olseni TaxID=32597 RepID=A0A7J6P2T9_PEROL|nr:hypothetical protein FOZ60_017372 [Perkinsus olseni]